MSTLEQFGEFVANCRPDDRTRALLRLRIADTIGAWAAAGKTNERRLLRRSSEIDEPLERQVALHCALVRLSEVDDIHLASMITPGAVVIPASLLIGATVTDLSADDWAAAVVAGYEAMTRLGAAIDGPSVLYRGLWPTYFAVPFGIAAMCSRLIRLDATDTAHALAYALITASPGVGHHTAPTTSRWLAIGQAAERGMAAIGAVRDGFTSDIGLLDGGFL